MDLATEINQIQRHAMIENESLPDINNRSFTPSFSMLNSSNHD